MAKWVRALHRETGDSGRWHLLDSDLDFVVADTYCGEHLPATLETTSTEERAERDGRCADCESRATAKRLQEVTATAGR